MARLVILYAATLAVGFTAALGVGWLSGKVWSSAFLPVSLIVAVWWAWLGWKHASTMDQNRKARIVMDRLQSEMDRLEREADRASADDSAG